MTYETSETGKIWKATSDQIQDGLVLGLGLKEITDFLYGHVCVSCRFHVPLQWHNMTRYNNLLHKRLSGHVTPAGQWKVGDRPVWYACSKILNEKFSRKSDNSLRRYKPNCGKCPISQWRRILRKVPVSGFGGGWLPKCNKFFLAHRHMSAAKFSWWCVQ